MHPTFERFRSTVLGSRIAAIVERPGTYNDFVRASRQGKPAVSVLVEDLRREFGDLPDHTARRFVGAVTAEVMRKHGHRIVRSRGRVPGGYFTFGAVFSADASPPPGAKSPAAGPWDDFFARPGVDFPDRLQPAWPPAVSLDD